MTKSIILAAVVSAFAFGSMAASASAQDYATCQAQAVAKTTGKPLAGASKAAFINKCMRNTCESQAVSKTGKKLAGAAKNSFMAKCLKGG
jgi:hypothetical protein